MDSTDSSLAQILESIKQAMVVNQLIVQGIIHPNTFGNMGNNWKIESVQNVDEMQLLRAQIHGLAYQIPNQQLNITNPNSITVNLPEPMKTDHWITTDEDGMEERRGQTKDKGKQVISSQHDDQSSSNSFHNITPRSSKSSFYFYHFILDIIYT